MKMMLNVVSKDTKCRSMASLRDMRVLGDLQWKIVVFLQGLYFPYNETTMRNRLERGVSLKVLDYRVTSP